LEFRKEIFVIIYSFLSGLGQEFKVKMDREVLPLSWTMLLLQIT